MKNPMEKKEAQRLLLTWEDVTEAEAELDRIFARGSGTMHPALERILDKVRGLLPPRP